MMLLWLLLLLLVPRHAGAQSGGLFVLVPFGARAVGEGDAVAADTTLGTEAMWWNPATLARLPQREIAVHHAGTAIAQTDMVAFAVPSKVLGTLAVSGLIVNYGSTEVTDINTGAPVGGTIGTYNYQLAATYAAPVVHRLNAGVTYKFLMIRSACSGNCGATTNISGSSNAVDLGLHYALRTRVPISVGGSIRNLGPAMQFRDAEQADPLPRIIQLGARVEVPAQVLAHNSTSLEVSADIFNADALGGTAAGIGMTLSYRELAFLQAGYKMQSGQGGGPSIGVGFRHGSIGVDVARRFDSFSSQLGETPTYVMVRARF